LYTMRELRIKNQKLHKTGKFHQVSLVLLK